jgi:PPK2 family polyphosphate:nucleotide phosphotransferase
MFDSIRIRHGAKLRLKRVDAQATPGWTGTKEKALGKLVERLDRLEDLQNLLWAQHRRKLLVVLQGMDTSGKDSTISHVFEGVNPLGVNVVAWKAPSEEELAHDFLWRIHARVPGSGEMTIFNRSHYEDVVTVRVRQLVPRKVWQPRYQQIRDFEQLLTTSGTTVLKFFLHIDQDEQKRRLQERLDQPRKHWKFQLSDLEDRKHWAEYMQAYGETLSETSTDHAPWYVVPANRKWYRDLVVSTVIVEALERLRIQPPKPAEDLDKITID